MSFAFKADALFLGSVYRFILFLLSENGTASWGSRGWFEPHVGAGFKPAPTIRSYRAISPCTSLFRRRGVCRGSLCPPYHVRVARRQLREVVRLLTGWSVTLRSRCL